MLPSAVLLGCGRSSHLRACSRAWREVAQQLQALESTALSSAGRSSQVMPAARHLGALASVHQQQDHQQHGHHSGSGSVAAVAAAIAAALGAVAATAPPTTARADAAAAAAPGSDSEAASKRQRFAAWMAARGADMSAAAVQPCQQEEGTGSGLGLFATPTLRSHMTHPWLGRRVGALLLRGAADQTVQVASVPLDTCLTLDAALNHPQLGHRFAELLQQGVLDERSAVVLLLLVERARGEDSPYAAWLDLLPSSSSSSSGPLFYSEQQLAELAGTTLAAATAARRAALQRQWEELQPLAAELLRQAGGGGGAAAAAAAADNAAPTYAQFLWATSIFWSRALSLPITYVTTGSATPTTAAAAAAAGAGEDAAADSSRVRFKVLEGLVPGVDFANHSQQPKCWWEVDTAATVTAGQKQQQQQQQQPGGADDAAAGNQAGNGSSSRSRQVVRLMANRVCLPGTGEQLTISYGDKGNEELLLLHGFAQRSNPHDSLMVLCPLPPVEEWDPVFHARMQLLQAKGLRPQYFLSANHYEAVTGRPLALASPLPPEHDTDSGFEGGASSSSSSSSSGGPAAAAGAGKQPAGGSQHRRLSRGARRAGGASIVPPGARDVLEVFVLDRHELASALEAAAAGGAESGESDDMVGGSSSSTTTTTSVDGRQEQEPEDVLQSRIQQLGVSMAVLTTFVRLLELKLIAMEGPEGTGSLESDLQQLAAAERRGIAAAASESGGAAGSSSSSSSSQGDWRVHCLVYRAGQKALVRGFLTEARAELQDTLTELQALLELQGESV